MPTEVFRPVDDGVVLPDRIMQGKPWRNIGFGINSTIADYAKEGLYREVGEKPVPTSIQKVVLISEVADHPTKTVVLTWELQDKSSEQIVEVQRTEGIETAQETGGLSRISVEDAENWVTARLMTAFESVQVVTDVQTAKTAMTQILLAIQEINHKEIPYFLNGK